MGVKVTVGSGNTANITGYSVQEDSTPLNPADSSGGVGQINVTVPEGSIDGSWRDDTKVLRANIVTNPSFESNTVGWAGNDAGVTISRDGSQQQSGAVSLKTICSGTAGQAVYTNVKLTVRKNQKYTASVWVKGEAGKSVNIELGEYTSSDVMVGTRTLSVVTVMTGSWQRLIVTRQFGSTGAKADVVVRNTDAVAHTFYVDSVMLELGSVPTEYFDGNNSQIEDRNYYWTGTTNNSISIERDGIWAVNQVANPSMETANTPNTLLRTNLIPNPSFANGIGLQYAWDDVANASKSYKTFNGGLVSTNFIINPNFETNVSGWVLGGSTLTRDTVTKYSGTASMKVVTTGATTQQGAYSTNYNIGYGTGAKFSASVYVNAPNGALMEIVAAGGSGGTNITTTFTGTGSWQFVKAENAVTGTNSNAYLVVRTRSTAQAITFYVDNAIVNLGSTVVDYFDGSTYGDWYEPTGSDVEISYQSKAGADGRTGYARVLTPTGASIIGSKFDIPSGVSIFSLSGYVKAEQVTSPYFMLAISFYDSTDTYMYSVGILPSATISAASWLRISETFDLGGLTTGAGWRASLEFTGDTTAVYVDNILLEANVGSINTYFDGDITDSADIIYGWSGQSNYSPSTMSVAKIVVRENLAINPSMETPTSGLDTISNLALNPSMEYANDATRSYTQRNYFQNPSFETNTGVSGEIDRNACYNPGLRVDGTGWATVASTITATGARVVGNFASVGTVGFWRSTATNAATGYIDARYGSATTTYVVVNAGYTYTASVYMRASYISTSTRIYILWYDTAGTLISQPMVEDLTDLAANTYRRMSITMTAPAGAVRAILIARCYGTSVVGSTMDGGAFMMEIAGTANTTGVAGNPGQYFDGSFAASGDFTYSWAGTTNASHSLRSALLVPSQTNANDGEGWQSSSYASIGTKTLAVKARDTTSSSYVAIALGNIGIANQVYTAKVTARTATGSFALGYSVTVYEDGGSSRNLATIIPSGTTLTTTPTEYTVTFTAPSDVNGNLRMLFRGGPAISQVVHYDKAFITQGDYSGNYFDGSNSTGIDSELNTAWEGTANNSISNIGAIRPDATSPSGSANIQSSLWSALGTKSLRIIPSPSVAIGSNSFAYLHSSDLIADGTLIPGETYTIMGTLRLSAAQTNPYSRARSIMGVFVRPGGTDTPTIGVQAPNAPGVYEISGTFTVPADTTSANIRLYNGDSYGGADVWWDKVLLTHGPYYGPYFDGDTTSTSELFYTWETPGSASKSIQAFNPVETWNFQPATGSVYSYQTTEQVLGGLYSLKVLMSGVDATLYCDNIFDTTQNTNYTVSTKVKGAAGKSVALSVQEDAGGTTIATSSPFTLTGGWDTVYVTFNSGTKENLFGLALINKETSTEQNVFYVDNVLIEQAEEVGEWFSGNTTDAGDFVYDWAGTTNLSTSVQSSLTVAGYTAVNCRAIRSGLWTARGTYSMRIEPTNDSTDTYVQLALPLADAVGKTFTVLGTSRLSAALVSPQAVSRQIAVYIDGVLDSSSTQAANSAGTAEHTVTFDVPVTASSVSVRLYNGADEFGGDVWWDKVALIEGEWTEGYFDGSTTDYEFNNYVWTGDANASTSEKRSRTQETDYNLFLNDVIDLEDGAQGTTRGTINSVNNTDGMLSLAGDSRLAVFIAERSVQPYPLPSGTYSTGTLGNAFAYYLSLIGITTGFSVDSSIASTPFKAQGWYGDMWAAMKQLCAAQRVEIALVSDNIVLRPVRTRIAENFRDISRSSSLQNTQLAERVEVYQYNNVTLNNAVVYPMPVWEWNSSTKSYGFVYGTLDSTPQVYQVNADETITVEIPINTSISSGTIKQPYAVDTIPLTNSAYVGVDSIYAIIDKEGKPYTAAQWNAGKGSISVKVLEDTKTLQVKIKGAKDVDRGPFRIARASADVTYPALYFVADGILANKELKTFYTGAPIAKVGQEVGITIDNPFIDSTSEAYTALAIASAKYAHPQQTISVQTVGINRTDTSQNFRYPTFDEFAAAQGVETFAQFEVTEANTTFAQYDAEWKTETIDTFENQAFGNVNGARVLYGAAWYRIRNATINESSVSYTAEADTLIEDFNDDNPYLTFKEFNTRFAGKKFEDYALIPLWQS